MAQVAKKWRTSLYAKRIVSNESELLRRGFVEEGIRADRTARSMDVDVDVDVEVQLKSGAE